MTEQEALRVLRKGRARIVRGWCKDALALNAVGNRCSTEDPQAVSWCVLGALGHEYMEGSWPLIRALPPEFHSIAPFNNARSTTHADILALFDRAIASLGGTPQRTDSELVADLMARVCGERIAEEA